MENKKILTIIVPSYNISKYISECVPTYIDEALFLKVNVLFVDDGATDNTRNLLKPFIDNYPNYFHFIHKENGGHGSVINTSISIIKTKYFKVVDGDDWIDSKELAVLVNYLSNTDDDLIITGFRKKTNDRTQIIKPTKSTLFSEGVSYPINKMYPFLLTIHNVTFKTSVFKNNNVKVRERVFYEDNEYCVFPLIYVNTFSFLEIYPYIYRIGNINQSISAVSQKKHLIDSKMVEDDLLSFYNRLPAGLDFKIRKIIAKRIVQSHSFYSACLVSESVGEAKMRCKNQWSRVKNNTILRREKLKRSFSNRILVCSRFALIKLFIKRWGIKY